MNSELGQGSEFIVKLPVNSSNLVMGENEFSSPDENREKPNEKLLKHHFDKIKLQVEVATDGNQALQKARSHVPDLITMDINMPNLNGWDTLAAMRADETLKNVPIVVVTVQEEKQRGLELGASDYLTKPINKEDVTSMVNRYIGL